MSLHAVLWLLLSIHWACAETTELPSTTQQEYVTSVPTEFEFSNETADIDKQVKYETDTELPVSECQFADVENGTEGRCQGCEALERDLCEEFQQVVKAATLYAQRVSSFDYSLLTNLSTAFIEKWSREYEEVAVSPEEQLDTVRMLKQTVDVCQLSVEAYIKTSQQMLEVQRVKNYEGTFNGTLVWGEIVAEQRKFICILEEFIQSGNATLIYFEEHQQFKNLILGKTIGQLLIISNHVRTLRKQRQYLELCEQKLALLQKLDFFNYTVRPFFSAAVFLIGITANVLLLIIFARQKEMRTTANAMLINLAAVDCISLVFNLPLTYVKCSYAWHLGTWGCRVFYYIRSITVCVSTYSVVAISLQRFQAVSQFPKAGGCRMGNRTKTMLMTTSVWLLALSYSMPHLIYSELLGEICSDLNDSLFGAMTSVDLVIICVVPISLIVLFSVLTASRIRRSASQLPGERAGQQKLRQNRVLSAHVLNALAVLFTVSYVPSFLFYFLKYQLNLEMEPLATFVVDSVVYVLQFFNSCFNPIALCIMSKKYRRYFGELLSCCGVPLKKLKTSTDVSVSTLQSSI